MAQPSFGSLAIEQIPDPDFADVTIGVLPAHATADPAAWARSLFSFQTMPRWVLLALLARQVLAPLMGVPRAPKDVFAVRCVEGEEALVAFDDRHLDFRVGVGVDELHNLVRITTTVRLKGWRGRVYFWPVRFGHPIVVRSMLRRSQKVLSGVTR